MSQTQRVARVGRSCEGCNLCCLHLEIESKPGHSTRPDNGEDLAKRAGETCRYSSAAGCTIYAQRPPVCREFHCDFVLGRPGYGPSDTPIATGVIGVRGVRYYVNARRVSGL